MLRVLKSFIVSHIKLRGYSSPYGQGRSWSIQYASRMSWFGFTIVVWKVTSLLPSAKIYGSSGTSAAPTSVPFKPIGTPGQREIESRLSQFLYVINVFLSKFILRIVAHRHSDANSGPLHVIPVGLVEGLDIRICVVDLFIFRSRATFRTRHIIAGTGGQILISCI